MWSTVESGSGSESGQAAPCARGKHSATLVGGHVYVLGGRGAGGAVPLRDFWRYTLATGVWERLECRGEPPPSLQEHSATAHEGRLFVFGGEAGAFSNETPLWIYDTETQVWRKLPGQAPRSSVRRAAGGGGGGGAGGGGGGGGDGAGPRARRGHSAHALRDCLLIYGGYKDLRGSTDELWAFHYESESWQRVRTSTAGPARHRHAAALHGARLYVHAGRCDLRPVADLWHYDTLSRVWGAVRGAGRGPGARSGHAAARAGAHLYIFGGEAHGHSCNDMWRFHFASETWERILPTVSWPAARVDACALLVGGRLGRAGAGARVEPRVAAREAGGILRELSRLSSFHIRRAARCSYSALAGGGEGERDSTESLVRQEAALAKSHSAYVIHRAAALPRERTSVPDLADALLCAEPQRPERAEPRVPHSMSVRFSRGSDDAELSTSDYASAERVGRAEARGFSNPHYLGPDVRALGLALTPDSGLGAGDIELQDLGPRRDRGPPPDAQLHLLLVGGKEPPHVALLQSPLSMWAYRLL